VVEWAAWATWICNCHPGCCESNDSPGSNFSSNEKNPRSQGGGFPWCARQGAPARDAVEIAPLAAGDRERWEQLARGYKAFYRTAVTDAQYDLAWQRPLRRDGIHGLGARIDGELVGIAHISFTPSCEHPRFAAEARAAGATCYYWMTQDHNTVARLLYDKVARHHGFIRYEYPL
jgi:hypothetical protein